MAVTLPLALFLCDYFLGQRINRKNLAEKIPFLQIAAFFALIALIARVSAGIANNPLLPFHPLAYICVAAYSILFYPAAALFPFGLCVVRPYPGFTLNNLPLAYLLAPFTLAAATGVVMRSAPKTKKIAFGALFYLTTIFPALLQNYRSPAAMVASDRYSYIPLLGIFYLCAEFSFFIYSKAKIRKRRIMLFAAGAGIAALLSYLSAQRCKIWKDSISLWNSALRSYPRLTLALNNRGMAYYQEKKFSAAISDFTRAIAYSPVNAKLLHNRANARRDNNDFTGALADYSRALTLQPANADIYNDRGTAYCLRGELNKALDDYNTAIKLRPDTAAYYNNRGILLRRMDEFTAALADYNRAIELDPGFAPAYENRAIANSYAGGKGKRN